MRTTPQDVIVAMNALNATIKDVLGWPTDACMEIAIMNAVRDVAAAAYDCAMDSRDPASFYDALRGCEE